MSFIVPTAPARRKTDADRTSAESPSASVRDARDHAHSLKAPTAGSAIPPNAPPLKYQKPSWSGFPNQQFYFEVIKNGIVIDEILVPEKQFLVIGRLPFCDLEMEHPSLSRYHAVVQFKSNGESFIYDLNSSHGTRLNKNKIPAGMHVALKPGDQLRFGESTRIYLFQTKDEVDREEEEQELVRQKIRQQSRHEDELPEEEEEQRDFDWGMKEDAVDEEADTVDGDFRQQVDENAYYRSDPKKALRNYLQGRGYAYEFELEESGPGHARVYTARIRLPLESAMGPIYGEATTGKKRDAEREAALDACIKLDSRANTTARSKKYDDDDDGDDDFYDRTAKVKKSAKKDTQEVVTHESLLEKHSRLQKDMAQLESRIQAFDAMEAERKKVEQENDLDAYMTMLEKSKGDSKGKMAQDLAILQKEEKRLLKLIELTKPVDYAAKLGGAPPKPSSTTSSSSSSSSSTPPKRPASASQEDDQPRDSQKRARVIDHLIIVFQHQTKERVDNMPKEFFDREEYSDDEYGYRSRSKFRRERSPEKDDFGRDKRRRKKSASPDDRERRPRRNRSSSRDAGDPGDHYIPNYDRDGYNPAPRYGRGEYGGRFGGMGEYAGYEREYRGSSRHREEGFMEMEGGGDMPGNWGGPGGERVDDPMKLDYLVSFKQFCEHLRGLDRASHRYRRYTDEELQSRYATYRDDFIAKHRSMFFDAHKDEAWFQEKYHPEHSKARRVEILTLRKKLYDQFVNDLANGKYDATTCDEDQAKAETGSKGAAAGGGRDDEEREDEEGELPNSDIPMLYLRAVLPNVSKKSLLEICQKIPGFRSLSLSEPHPLKELQRIGWIKLEQGTDTEEALKAITEVTTDDYQVSTTPHRPTRARYTHEVASSDARLQADRELVELVAKACDRDLNEAVAALAAEGATDSDGDTAMSSVTYDGVSLLEKRLQSHILPALEKNVDDSEQEEGAIKTGNERQVLDMYIEYLRQVHMFCYYCGGESDNLEEFARKCVKHYRKPEPRGGSNAAKGATWVKNLEQKLQVKVYPPSDEEVEKLGGKSMEKSIVKFLQQKTQQQEPAKWRCKICTKPFRGEEFVHKHIRSKHPDDVKEVEESVQLFNNYVLDPYHINPATQPHQQPLQAPAMHSGPHPAAALMGAGPMPLHFGAGSHPMPMPFMGPTGVSPMFPHGFVPPSFSATAALAGTPMDQIPRIGFDIPKRVSKDDDSKRGKGGGDGAPSGGSSRGGLQLDPRSRMTDPRQVKSYVDLDAPAEGDLDAKYNLW
ncbi:Kanadaptin [Actinomortierella ambigua]|nr:Kanadaptin [Actinomortierella ambigua]